MLFKMKRLLKYLRNILITILLLIAVLFIFSQTGIFKDFLRDKITGIINGSINGTISIGSIEGNLFTDIGINNIQIVQSNHQLIFVKDIKINYNPLSLLTKKVNIHYLILDSINFNLVQSEDSAWNISKISKSTEETTDTTTGSFDWEIAINKFEIRNSTFNISPLDSASSIPKKIENINLEISGIYNADRSILRISRFGFITVKPSLELRDFHLTAYGSKNELKLPELYIETKLNKIVADGEFKLNPLDSLILNIKTEPLNISEFNDFIGNQNIKFSPSVIININKKDKNIYLLSTIKDKKQSAVINLHVIENSFPEGTAEIKLNNINPAVILEKDSLECLINADFNIKGYWKNINDSQIELAGNLFNSSFLKRKINSKISVQLNMGKLKSDVNMRGDFGLININAIVNKINKNPAYSFQLLLDKVDLSKILNTDTLNSDLNLTIDGNAEGFNPENMNNKIKISTTEPSRINKFMIDSLFITATKNKNQYLLDSLFIKNGRNKITASGEYLTSNLIKTNLHLLIVDFEKLRHFMNADTLGGTLVINGEFSGLLDSLLINSDINLDNFCYNNLSLNSFTGKVNGLLNNHKIDGNYNFQFNDIRYDSVSLSAIDLEGNYKDEQLNSKTNIIFSDNLKTNISSSIKIDSATNILLPALTITNENKVWQNKKGPINISIYKNNYSLKNFSLQNDTSSIYIDAGIRNNKELMADIKINSIKLQDLFNRLNLKTKISGLADLNIKAEGNTDDPAVTGNLKLNRISIDKNDLGDITAEFNIKEKIFKWELLLRKTGNQLKSSGFIPLNLARENSEGFIDKQKELEINLSLDNFDLSKVKSISNYFDKLEGNVNFNISVKNNLMNPQLKGNLQLRGASVQNNNLGIDYRDIKMDLQIDSNRIKLDTASFASNKGNIILSGYAGSKTNILEGKLNDVNINLHSSNFELLSKKGTSISLDGDFNLFSRNDSIRFNGDFEIPRSSIYLSSSGQSKMGSKDIDAPILLQAFSKNETGLNTTDSTKTPLTLITSRKDINGKIKIRIPDNTWIKNPNFNIELKGVVTIEKKDTNLTLTGKIQTGRGYLYLYGKKFTVTKGELVFTGGKKINPYINASIEYVFRNPSREKEKIIIDITNTIDNPDIKFTHNNEIISEGDAVSYIIFGMKMDNLTQSQQSELSGNQNIVSNAVAGMLASQLSSKLGRTIGVDVLEISGGENWETASLTAGKYITNDLFVSYEHDFPLGNSNETEMNKINFEYELFHFLFFQVVGGNSKETGINFILKFD